MMIVLTLVFSNIFRFAVEYYPVYVLSGLIIWNFFSSSTSGSMQNIVLSGNLLNRIYVPKSVFAVSASGVGLVNLGLSLIPLFAIALILGITIGPQILVMPIAILLLWLFTLGLSFILQTAAVFFADMIPVYDVILMVWFYATPIIYPEEMIPAEWSWVYQLNPMYYYVRLFRDPLFKGTIPEAHIWVVAALFALVAFILGGLIFTSKSKEYAYRI
jgi:ABC-type polysaccharide/polyol phosphate export permease